MFLTKLVALYDRVNASVNEGKPTDVIYLVFVKPLIWSPITLLPLNGRHMVLIDKLLDGYGTGWVVASKASQQLSV